jgi:hypothetical protein
MTGNPKEQVQWSDDRKVIALFSTADPAYVGVTLERRLRSRIAMASNLIQSAP